MTTTFNDPVAMAKTGSAAGSPSNSVTFECVTTGGARVITVRAKPYDSLIDDYWLEILRHNGIRLAIFEDFTYVSGYSDGVLNLSFAGLFVPWLSQFYGALIIGQNHVVNAGETYNLGALSDPQLLGQASRIPCRPSATQGCTVVLPPAAYALRYEIGDYSGNAAVQPVAIKNMAGETINGVDHSTTPLLIDVAYKQLTLQGDDVSGTNWIIV